MTILLATDIFGHTEHIDEIANTFSQSVVVVSPYENAAPTFKDEQEAYQTFIDSVGLEKYKTKLSNAIKTHKPNTILGFSVGASALWMLSDSVDLPLCQMQLFYPSQIRHRLDVQPCVPVQLVLPESEPHFSVPDLIRDIRSKPNLDITHTQYLHGFMNRYSTNYDQGAYDEYLRLIQDLASQNKMTF